jgi:hypothetical protein
MTNYAFFSQPCPHEDTDPCFHAVIVNGRTRDGCLSFEGVLLGTVAGPGLAISAEPDGIVHRRSIGLTLRDKIRQ